MSTEPKDENRQDELIEFFGWYIEITDGD